MFFHKTSLVVMAILNFLYVEIECSPVAFPQFARQRRQTTNNGFETAITAGISGADGDDDCFEAAVNGGLAAKPDVGADLKFVGVNSGGIRCKQGKNVFLNIYLFKVSNSMALNLRIAIQKYFFSS